MELVLIGIDMNQIIHRRGGLNPPECINRYTIGMLSGRFNLPLRWMAMLFIFTPFPHNSCILNYFTNLIKIY